MLLDIQKTSKDILIDEINAENTINLVSSDLDFSLPEVYKDVTSTKNTAITVTMRVSSAYYGSRKILYTRMDLGAVLGMNTIPFVNIYARKLSDIIPSINLAYGINLTTDDYEDTDLPIYDPLNPDKVIFVNIVAKPTSLLFIGSVVFVLNSKTTLPVDDAGVTRTFYLHNSNFSLSDYKRTIISLANDGTLNTSFNLLINVSEVTVFNLAQMLIKNSGDLVLNGDFALKYVDSNGVLKDVTAKSLVIYPNGSLKTYYSTYLFNADSTIIYTENKLVNFKYAIDATKVIRYTDDGALDNTYTTFGITYKPDSIFLCDNGKLLTVSPLTNKKITIDRLLPTGAIDPSFNPIVFTGTGTNNPLPIVQIKPVNLNGLWVLVYPTYGVDVGSISTVVNGTPLVPADITQSFAWNPIIKFTENGTWDTTFSTLLQNNNEKSIYLTTGSTLKVNDKVLSGDINNITFFTYKSNPVTGFDHKQPITFDYSGKLLTMTGTDYQNQYRWVNCKKVSTQFNKQVVSFGTMVLPLTSGGYSGVSSCVARYNHDGSISSLIYRNDSSANELVNVVFNEAKV